MWGQGRGGRGKGTGSRGGGSVCKDDHKLVNDQKLNFVEAPKRCFKKNDGYNFDPEMDKKKEGQTEETKEKEDGEEEEDAFELEAVEQVAFNFEIDCQENAEKEEDKIVEEQTEEKKEEKQLEKVTRCEWNRMTCKERKKYLKERRRWKTRNIDFIKDDSDKEE